MRQVSLLRVHREGFAGAQALHGEVIVHDDHAVRRDKRLDEVAGLGEVAAAIEMTKDVHVGWDVGRHLRWARQVVQEVDVAKGVGGGEFVGLTLERGDERVPVGMI